MMTESTESQVPDTSTPDSPSPPGWLGSGSPLRSCEALAEEHFKIARLIQQIVRCDVVAFLSIDSGTLSIWSIESNEGGRSIGRRTRVRDSCSSSLALHLRSYTDAVITVPSECNALFARLGYATLRCRLLVPLAVGFDYQSALLIGCTGRVFSAVDAEHVSLLAPGLRMRFDRTDDRLSRGTHAALTPRETQVLALVGRGLTARTVGHQLGISVRTVHKHLEHVYKKLGCRDRVSAILQSRAAGLVNR